MADIDKQLDEMSNDDLVETRQKIDDLLVRRERERKQNAHAAAAEAARSYGFSLADLLSGQGQTSSNKSKNPPKYRNPHNPTQTWTGRGRHPKWFTKALDKGLNEEDMKA